MKFVEERDDKSRTLCRVYRQKQWHIYKAQGARRYEIILVVVTDLSFASCQWQEAK